MRRRRILLVLLGVSVIFAAWCAFVAISLARVRDDAQAGVDRLEAVRDLLSPSDLVDGVGLDELQAAGEDFTQAHDRLRSPMLAPVRALPIAGRQVRSVDALTGAAADVIDAGIVAIEDAREVLDTETTSGSDRVRIATELAAVSNDALAAIRDVDLGPDDALVGPVADARSRFEDELTQLRDTLAAASDASRGLASFLEGPSRYLVLAANNAEMRVGSGAFLSVGTLDVADGRFTLTEMTPAEDLLLPPGSVPLDEELAALWGWLEPNREWRNLAASPRFETQAALAARMWQASTGEQIDGVLALDPVALGEVLDVVGAVEVDGREISADDVVGYALSDQYAEFDDSFDQSQRRDRLSEIARAALQQIDAAEWEPSELFEALRRSAEGRHVLAWSNDPVQLAGWRAAGVTGELDPDGVLVGLHNRGGNKLDYFLDVAGAIDVVPTDGGSEVSLALELSNTAPTGLPQYVAGPYPGAVGGAEGLYQGLVVAQLPGYASRIRIEDDQGRQLGLVASGPDGPDQVVAAYVEVPRGGQEGVIIRFDVPSSSTDLVIEPSARVPEVEWSFGTDRWVDEESHRVAF